MGHYMCLIITEESLNIRNGCPMRQWKKVDYMMAMIWGGFIGLPRKGRENQRGRKALIWEVNLPSNGFNIWQAAISGGDKMPNAFWWNDRTCPLYLIWKKWQKHTLPPEAACMPYGPCKEWGPFLLT